MLNLRNELFWHIDRYETGNDRWQSSQWLAIWNSCHGRSSGMRTQWLLALIRMDTGNVSTRQSQKKQKQSVIIHPSPDILCFYFPISFLNQAQTFYWNKCARKSPPPEGKCFVFCCCACGGEDIGKIPTWVYADLGVAYSWKSLSSFRGLHNFLKVFN